MSSNHPVWNHFSETKQFFQAFETFHKNIVDKDLKIIEHCPDKPLIDDHRLSIGFAQLLDKTKFSASEQSLIDEMAKK